ncbi:hypothetical protein ACOSP7_010184 [Xanthoceras sorbifolium]|uniref:Cytochrome c oxidase subunit 6b-1 n=1 Tax=Xanthoceras sorbifolium TaxID=99658 RepID=A0ABQ8HTV2_9ROSI|nr:hypothetical protein JRO89_XS07G0130900 [Xanthoceras sorbifolium]
MAEALSDRTPSLAEEYLLKGKEEKQDVPVKPVEVKEAENPVSATQEVVSEKAAEAPAAVAEEITEVTPTPAAEESTESSAASPEDNSSENAPAAAEESSEENSGDQEAAEESRELRLETAPADFRFPTTNQTRHCFTRYIEYHRCVAAKGEDAPECDRFAKYYRALCPGEWVDRWNEQRENGTFPGPL